MARGLSKEAIRSRTRRFLDKVERMVGKEQFENVSIERTPWAVTLRNTDPHANAFSHGLVYIHWGNMSNGESIGTVRVTSVPGTIKENWFEPLDNQLKELYAILNLRKGVQCPPSTAQIQDATDRQATC